MLAFNANTQQEEQVVFSLDASGEIICNFPDGHFLKFPEGTSQPRIVALLEEHKVQNEGNEVITPEMENARIAALAASQTVVDDLNDGNTMPSGNQTNVSPQDLKA